MPHARPQRADEARTGSQTIDRAAQLLRLVCARRALGASLTDLVKASGLTKPTARRTLIALIDNGLVEQSADRIYYAGAETYALGLFAGERFGILQLAAESVARVAQISGDACLLSIPRGNETVCLAREEGSYPLRSHVLQPGHRHPLGCGAPGIALLAPLPDDAIRATLEANEARLKLDYPGVTPEVVWHQVKKARRLGYALNEGLIFPGSWGIAVPVVDENGATVAALAIAGVEPRFTKARIDEMGKLLGLERSNLERRLHDRRRPAR
jgi:DNA-binding IclR family transcriptional regulator